MKFYHSPRYPSLIILFHIGVLFSLTSNLTAGNTEQFDSGNYEVRWFYQGKLPEGVSKWFIAEEKFGKSMKEEKRTDLYLVTKKAKFLSPKLREGKLEIKYRSSDLDFVACEGKISGIAENWSKEKWSYSKGADKEVRAAFLEKDLKGRRAEVFKSRRQRKFKISPDGSVEPVPMAERLPVAALIEVTELKVNGASWWTVAYEIFSDSDISMDKSQRIACYLFQNYPGPKLRKENSYAYPKWLSMLLK